MATPWSKNEYAVKSEKGVKDINNKRCRAKQPEYTCHSWARLVWVPSGASTGAEHRSICEPNSNFLESTNLSVANNSRKQ